MLVKEIFACKAKPAINLKMNLYTIHFFGTILFKNTYKTAS